MAHLAGGYAEKQVAAKPEQNPVDICRLRVLM